MKKRERKRKKNNAKRFRRRPVTHGQRKRNKERERGTKEDEKERKTAKEMHKEAEIKRQREGLHSVKQTVNGKKKSQMRRKL